jgi:hypothetical protein
MGHHHDTTASARDGLTARYRRASVRLQSAIALAHRGLVTAR